MPPQGAIVAVLAIAGGVGYLVVVTVAIALLPSFDEVPTPVTNDAGQIVFPGFPGDVIGDFRVYAIANQVILWTVLTAVFALVLGAMSRSRSSKQVVDDPATQTVA